MKQFFPCALFLLAAMSHAAVPASGGVGQESVVTFASLLAEMSNPAALARWPEPAFVLKQASSYDRRSVNPGHEEWFANRDWSAFLRTNVVKGSAGESPEHVMLDEAGPGAIVRFWAGGFTDRGIVRIYFDGATEPLLSGTADELIGGGKYFPEPFAATRARGRNLYAPLPFAKRIKVTYDGPLPTQPDKPGREGFWYNLEYRAYAAGTAVESFSPATLLTMPTQLAAVAAIWSRYSRLADQSIGTLAPGKSFRAHGRPGPAALSGLQLRLRAQDIEAALRETVLTIVFDGRRTVQVPVGDFFGSGIGLNPFEDRWQRVDHEGNMSVNWIMPYRERCEIEVVNHGMQPIEFAYAVGQSAWSWDRRSLYFHAGWRRGDGIETTKPSDFNYLTLCGGRGVYIGDTLSVFNPVAQWWGEGDEKIYVDGEVFPSHFGTGTEDYYGYAWGDTTVFSAPFHAQPRAGTKHQGHTTNTRVRILDAIPFRESLTFDMEVWHWQPTRMDYAVATFWYGEAALQDNAAVDLRLLSVPKPRQAIATAR